MNKLDLNILDAFFLIQNGCLNCFKIVNIKDYEKNVIIFFFFFVIEKYINRS